MAIEKELLKQLLAGRDPMDLFNKDGLVHELKKALSERILDTELDEHLGGDGAEGKSNYRNGDDRSTSKMTLAVPRDGAGTFDPKLIAEYQRRFSEFGHLDVIHEPSVTAADNFGVSRCAIIIFLIYFGKEQARGWLRGRGLWLWNLDSMPAERWEKRCFLKPATEMRRA